MSEQEIARRMLSSTAGLSAQAMRLHLALLAGYDRNDIDGLARVLGASRRSVYRWLQEIASCGTPVASSGTPLENLAREAEEIAKQARDLVDSAPELSQPAPELSQPAPLPPHTPPTPENLTSPPPIAPPQRRRRSGITDEEMAAVSAIVGECNRLWGKRFTPQAHADYIVRRLRRFPDVTLDEHIQIVQQASASPWWTGEPSPRVIYSRDDLFDAMRQERGVAPRKTTSQSRGDRQRQLLGGNIFEEVTGGNSADSSSSRIALARSTSH